MPARPESGPNENMKIWLPLPIVEKPSPPEICWHLIAPFTVAGVGVTKSPLVPAGTPGVGALNCVGPLYGGSELFTPVFPGSGWVIVLVGHCTRNDCALAATAANVTKSMDIQTWYDFLMAVQPPYLDPKTAPVADSGCDSSVRGGIPHCRYASAWPHLDKEESRNSALVSRLCDRCEFASTHNATNLFWRKQQN